MDILFIDACVREESRTRRLAEALLERLPGEVCRVELQAAGLRPLDRELLALREELVARQDYDHELFRQARLFREAEQVVIAAPCWDLSFPALLKVYLEQIMVSGLTFTYTEQGFPVGLCRARRLFYLSTAGGPVPGEHEGFRYVRQLGESFLGIRDIRLIQAEKLDVVGPDAEAILSETLREIGNMEL